MAVTVTPVCASESRSGRNEDVWGTRRVGVYRVTFDSSYLTGGEPFDPRAVGFQAPVASVFVTKRHVAASIDWIVQYDFANKTLFVTVGSTGAQVASTTDLSTLVVDVIVVSD